MGLDPYGVLVGTLDHYERDDENEFGQYYHENLWVAVSGDVNWHCAVDVDSKKTNDGIKWRVVPMSEQEMKGVAALPDGWHVLAKNANSGAIDNIRTASFHRPGCAIVFVRYDPLMEMLRQLFNSWINPPWTAGTSKQALAVFEPLLDGSQRVFVFGQRFNNNGKGVHNIHQNQGDPPNTPWWNENAIWQDGGTIIQRPDGSYVAFLTKFTTQADNTDVNGHPI